MPTLESAEASNSSIARASCSATAASKAFFTSGRLMVITWTGPCCSTKTVVVATSYSLYDGPADIGRYTDETLLAAFLPRIVRPRTGCRQRRPEVEVCRSLVGRTYAEERCFIKGAPDYLHTDRQTVLVEPAGHVE